MDEVAERIIRTAKIRGYNQKQLAQKLGIHPQVVTDWKKGPSTSYTDYLPKIAETLGVTTDYLLTGKEPVIQFHIPEQHLDDELVAELTSATPDEITQVRAYLQGLKAGRKAPVFPDK